MTDVSRLQVETALKQYIDPYLDKDLVSTRCVRNITIENGKVEIDVVLGFPAAGYVAPLSDALRALVQAIAGVSTVQVSVRSEIVSRSVQRGVQPLEGVKNIIVVASGKGGVGKSTTSVNLALALAAEGARVGILDADIYGPSQPTMLGSHAKPDSKDGKTMEPVVSHGLQSMSIGYMIGEDTPMVWRGPMVTGALLQLLNDTHWQDLDYLVVDLPPGTGDIQLTLAQKVPVAGAVIVTTPQDIALIDAKKAIKMFEKVSVPVLGIVENMSIHICSKCGHAEHIFGEGGAARMAEQYDIDFLGALPLDIRIREHVDSGRPTVVAEPEGRIAQLYREIARHTAARLAQQSKDYSSLFPNIVIQND